MVECECTEPHVSRRIVLTGGPGAGKTAVLELVKKSLCKHVRVLPEAASIVFGGGFPREPSNAAMRAVQRAIFHIQRELETATEASDVAILLCDRGTVDGVAYWPGSTELWPEVGTTLDEQLARYHAVIHLRTPAVDGGYNHVNPLRTETAEEAHAIDERIAAAWARHPRWYEIEPASDFLTKAARAVAVLRDEVPPCCRPHFDKPG